MNLKHQEVREFLDKDLLSPSVIFDKVKPTNAEALEAEWKAMQANPNKFAPDYVEEVRQK